MTINHAGNHNFRFDLWSHPVKSKNKCMRISIVIRLPQALFSIVFTYIITAKNKCMRNIIVIRLPRALISILITSNLIVIGLLHYHICSQLASISFQNRDIIFHHLYSKFLIGIGSLPYHICSQLASISFSNWTPSQNKIENWDFPRHLWSYLVTISRPRINLRTRKVGPAHSQVSK